MMIKKNRTIISLLLAALLCLLFPQRAQAEQAASVTVSFDQEQYAPGDTATVQIRLLAADSTIQVAGFEFQLADAAGLELQTLTMTSGSSPLEDGTGTSISDASAASGRGVYCQYGTGSVTVDEKGIVVAEATYLVTGQSGDTVQMGLKEWTLLQADGTTLSAGQQQGRAVILQKADETAPTLVLSADSTLCKAGDIITVTLFLAGDEASYSVYGINDTIAFDPTCFELLPDSVSAFIGSAAGKKTNGEYDRVFFSRADSNAVIITKDAPIVTFRLKVLMGGTIHNTWVTYSDDVGNELPINLQDTSVELYNTTQPPLIWHVSGSDLVLRNYSDAPITADIWLASYRPGGQMQSVSHCSRATLDGGAQLIFAHSDLPLTGESKMLVTEAGTFAPISPAFLLL